MQKSIVKHSMMQMSIEPSLQVLCFKLNECKRIHNARGYFKAGIKSQNCCTKIPKEKKTLNSPLISYHL